MSQQLLEPCQARFVSSTSDEMESADNNINDNDNNSISVEQNSFSSSSRKRKSLVSSESDSEPGEFNNDGPLSGGRGVKRSLSSSEADENFTEVINIDNDDQNNISSLGNSNEKQNESLTSLSLPHLEPFSSQEGPSHEIINSSIINNNNIQSTARVGKRNSAPSDNNLRRPRRSRPRVDYNEEIFDQSMNNSSSSSSIPIIRRDMMINASDGDDDNAANTAAQLPNFACGRKFKLAGKTEYCEFISPTSSGIKAHRKAHEKKPEPGRVHCCSLCPMQFTTPQHAGTHITNCHSKLNERLHREEKPFGRVESVEKVKKNEEDGQFQILYRLSIAVNHVILLMMKKKNLFHPTNAHHDRELAMTTKKMLIRLTMKMLN